MQFLDLFTYEKAVDRDDKCADVEYINCVLLHDLPYLETYEQFISWHEDERCKEGTKIDLIIRDGNYLCGWIGDDLVIDTHYDINRYNE